MNNATKRNKPLFGVNCEVSDCIYHNGISNCTAEYINIKSKISLNGTNTRCDTFKQK